MSFSKAKIIRFNDTPTSGITKSKSLGRAKKHGNHSCSPTNSESGSVKSVPGNFKTPTLPKKTLTKSATKTITPKELFSTDLKALKEKTAECENKTVYIHQLTAELDQLKLDVDNLKSDKEELEREHQNEMQNLECKMLDLMSKLQKIKEESGIKEKDAEEMLQKEIETLKKSHEYKVGQLVLDYEIKLKDLRESSEEELGKKLEELEKDWKEKLENKEAESIAILQECQAISEYSIIQCEMEKKQVQKLLDKAKASNEALKVKLDELSTNKQQLETIWAIKDQELNNKILQLGDLIKEKDEELAKLTVEVKAYQVTNNSSQVTIEVLKRRLIDSDRDVEQLKRELTLSENKLLDYENKHGHLTQELKQAQQCMEDLEYQYNSTCMLNQGSINAIKEELIGQVDYLKGQVKDYSKKIDVESFLKKEIMLQLNDNMETMKHINTELKHAEEAMDILSEENELLKEEVASKEGIIKELEEAVSKGKEANKELNDKYIFYKEVTEEYENEAVESMHNRKKYIEISGKYDSLLQDFETVEMENRKYKSEMESLRQKLERLLDIEEQFEEMKKEKSILESENLFYKAKFDEQKPKKHYKLGAKDKENLGSPNRSIVESPNRGSPFRGSPFRERN